MTVMRHLELQSPSGAESAAGAPRAIPRWLRAVFAVPLMVKILGAGAIIVIIALSIALTMPGLRHSGKVLVVILALALGATLVVNLFLVAIALRPMRDLEVTADRVWHGDLAARVPSSLLADRDMARVGSTINLLLDGLVSDRARMRRLASQVINVQDQERARIARELHDSAAQSLTALVLQLSAAVRDCTDEVLAARLEDMRRLTVSVLEEVRTLSHSLHPQVLDDLGLPAALEWLARHASQSAGIPVTVDAPRDVQSIPPIAAAALYRIAQEALGNAMRHAAAKSVMVRLRRDHNVATLEVRDDGRGFDVRDAEERRPGMGLFSMQERMALVDGHWQVISAPGAGTHVIATVPLVPQETL
ncbi:MAG TPA: sensor histidine kinase [Casimicrobiaceae bacterium]|jgi:signal transduction histidine kinase